MIHIEPSADVDGRAHLPTVVDVWHLAQIREFAVIGEGTSIGRGAYIDHDVIIGRNCKIQNYALIYYPSCLGDGAFIGPAAQLINDRHPRAINPDGSFRTDDDWKPEGVKVERGASIGAGAIIMPGVTIGERAMVGAGAVVTRDVSPFTMVVGNPAFEIGPVEP